jgi:hypothetical protein
MYRIDYLSNRGEVIRTFYEASLYSALKHTNLTKVAAKFQDEKAVSIQFFKAETADAIGFEAAMDMGRLPAPHYYHFDW